MKYLQTESSHTGPSSLTYLKLKRKQIDIHASTGTDTSTDSILIYPLLTVLVLFMHSFVQPDN
jgi:hypothetical protein